MRLHAHVCVCMCVTPNQQYVASPADLGGAKWIESLAIVYIMIQCSKMQVLSAKNITIPSANLP